MERGQEKMLSIEHAAFKQNVKNLKSEEKIAQTRNTVEDLLLRSNS